MTTHRSSLAACAVTAAGAHSYCWPQLKPWQEAVLVAIVHVHIEEMATVHVADYAKLPCLNGIVERWRRHTFNCHAHCI